MNNADNMIPFFTTCFQVCLAFTILFFVISVILFFIFDIRTIFNIRTGRAKRRTISEMQKANSRTGRLRVDGRTLTEQLDKNEKRGHRPFSSVHSNPVNATPREVYTNEAVSGTQVLDAGADKTSLLENGAIFQNSEIGLGNDQTAALKSEENTDNVEMNKTNEYVDVHFVVRKRMIVVHTNEVI